MRTPRDFYKEETYWDPSFKDKIIAVYKEYLPKTIGDFVPSLRFVRNSPSDPISTFIVLARLLLLGSLRNSKKFNKHLKAVTNLELIDGSTTTFGFFKTGIAPHTDEDLFEDAGQYFNPKKVGTVFVTSTLNPFLKELKQQLKDPDYILVIDLSLNSSIDNANDIFPGCIEKYFDKYGNEIGIVIDKKKIDSLSNGKIAGVRIDNAHVFAEPDNVHTSPTKKYLRIVTTGGVRMSEGVST